MKIKICTLAVIVTLLSTSFKADDGWTALLDQKLSKWEMYLSFRHQPGYNGQPPKNAKGELVQPVGFNKNEGNVFSMIQENGKPVLKITGEIYGCLYTKQDFENYHLKLMVKFGTKKWPPRLDEPMDSGLLYHSVGKPGVDYWRSWMLAHEFQIMEGGFGDYWCVSQTGAYIKMYNPESRRDMGIYSIDGQETRMGSGGNRTGFVRHNENMEKPGEWNSVELICFGDKSIHIVNGKVVMAVGKSYYKDGDAFKPLTKGKIQLQCEAAEVYYKDVFIKNLGRVPAQYAQYFN
ncbi:3-keto-disaccharide hydrolase [Dyadobacter bucti]|uniref:3-keto-disaccharide hydrolase n=1 Tax=Dyadobacter bucti TaxID=2572203 RepID=UPI001108C6FE|nr:DUF1080 domain-containing protein [Dyadobacter bucti]